MTGAIRQEYTDFKSGVDVITSTVGSIISCNLITPVLRNQYAASKQKEILAKRNMQKNNPEQPEKPKILRPLSMADYQKLASLKFSGGNMKV